MKQVKRPDETISNKSVETKTDFQVPEESTKVKRFSDCIGVTRLLKGILNKIVAKIDE